MIKKLYITSNDESANLSVNLTHSCQLWLHHSFSDHHIKQWSVCSWFLHLFRWHFLIISHFLFTQHHCITIFDHLWRKIKKLFILPKPNTNSLLWCSSSWSTLSVWRHSWWWQSWPNIALVHLRRNRSMGGGKLGRKSPAKYAPFAQTLAHPLSEIQIQCWKGFLEQIVFYSLF